MTFLGNTIWLFCIRRGVSDIYITLWIFEEGYIFRTDSQEFASLISIHNFKEMFHSIIITSSVESLFSQTFPVSSSRVGTITEHWTQGWVQLGASTCGLCVLSSGVICNCISSIWAIGQPDNREKNQGRGFHFNHIHIFPRVCLKRFSKWIKRWMTHNGTVKKQLLNWIKSIMRYEWTFKVFP